jgi:hypothetical protein
MKKNPRSYDASKKEHSNSLPTVPKNSKWMKYLIRNLKE